MTNSTNLHFHGLNASPACHQDEVIHTLIQPSQSFDYQVQIPPDEPPGLYWYHPHPHGFSAGQVRGGATGALIVEGIESLIPSLAGLPQRTWVLRDQVRDERQWRLHRVQTFPLTLRLFLPRIPASNGADRSKSEGVLACNQRVIYYNFQCAIHPSAVYVSSCGWLLSIAFRRQRYEPAAIDPNEHPVAVRARAEFVLTTQSGDHAGDRKRGILARTESGSCSTIANIVSQTRPQRAGLRSHPRNLAYQKSSRFAGLRAPRRMYNGFFISQRILTRLRVRPSILHYSRGQTGVFDMNQSPNIVVQRGASESWT
jgi:hypothetical protein